MSKSVLHGIFKVCPSCRKRFATCVKCDRGHRYFSAECRVLARRLTFRRASKIYQSTDNGRTFHRKRQKTYRKNRRIKESVTHHPSRVSKKELKQKAVGFAQNPNFKTDHFRTVTTRKSVCRFCQRKIEWFIRSG